MTETLPAPLPDYLTLPNGSDDLMREELLHVIRHAIDNHPRSLQVQIGPSEIGHACARRIGYKLLDYDENPSDPNWKATVGTAVHAWLEDIFGTDNTTQYDPANGVSRWILEATLDCGTYAGGNVTGHCDVYDQVTFTVIDWKAVGPTQLKKYKAKGPGPQYRTQAHTYGYGWRRAGRRVDRVAVMFLPRDGELRDAHFWSEPYDEQVALEGLKRLNGIHLTVTALSDKALPILPTADAFCRMCPYYKAHSTDLTRGCPGDPAAQQPRTNPALTLG